MAIVNDTGANNYDPRGEWTVEGGRARLSLSRRCPTLLGAGAAHKLETRTKQVAIIDLHMDCEFERDNNDFNLHGQGQDSHICGHRVPTGTWRR